MKYRLLGSTGLFVSEMCLGTMTFGDEGFWKVMGALGQKSVNELIAAAIDAGINFIDTANVYSLGQSEMLTGQAIRDLKLPRDKIVIATKATGQITDDINGCGQSRYHLMNQLDASLKRLQLDHIDLYQLHGFDPLTPFEEVMETLNDMVRSGKVRHVGLCNLAAWQIMKAQGFAKAQGLAKFASVQAYYTIAGRDLEREVIPLILDQKLGLMVWSPLAGGLLSGKYDKDGKGADGRRANFDFPPIDKPRAFACIEVMRRIAEAKKVTVAQIALAWLLAQKAVSSVIIGARNINQLNDNIAACAVSLSTEELAELDKVSALPVEYPGWMIEMQSSYRKKPNIVL